MKIKYKNYIIELKKVYSVSIAVANCKGEKRRYVVINDFDLGINFTAPNLKSAIKRAKEIINDRDI